MCRCAGAPDAATAVGQCAPGRRQQTGLMQREALLGMPLRLAGKTAGNRRNPCWYSGSISRWPRASTCRTKSLRGWQARSTPSSSPPRRDVRNEGPNPDSMDLYFQGLAWFNKGVTRDNLAQAQSFFDRALTADPGNVDALVVGSARADPAEGANFFVTSPARRPKRSWPKPCLRSRTMRSAICTWDLSTCATPRATLSMSQS